AATIHPPISSTTPNATGSSSHSLWTAPSRRGQRRCPWQRRGESPRPRRLSRAPPCGGGVSLLRSAPVPYPHARRRTFEGPNPRLGDQPVLLPDAHSDQRRDHPLQVG